jgi:hypothetical protein
LVENLATVKPVLEDQVKRHAGEFLAPIFGAVGPRAALAPDPGSRKRVPQRMHGFEREKAPINIDNDACLWVSECLPLGTECRQNFGYATDQSSMPAR